MTTPRSSELANAQDVPWYVRFISQVGVPAAIAVGLTFFLTSVLSRDMHETRSTQELMLRAEEAMATTHLQLLETEGRIIENQRHIVDLLAAHALATDRLSQILTALCINTSRLDEDRRRCLNFSK